MKIWEYALEQKANVVLMRHAPKAGSDNSDLSEEGKRLAASYGDLLRIGLGLWDRRDRYPLLACTNKARTAQTLKLLFPLAELSVYHLDANKVSPFVQAQVDELHEKVGRFRGYSLNHTYYFLEKLGGRFDEENLHAAVAERMARRIKSLFDFGRLVIYCGHSPAIEVALEKLLGISLAEMGGFLNPLDSVHLRMNDGKIEWIARVNPIVDYVDLEAESYFKNKV